MTTQPNSSSKRVILNAVKIIFATALILAGLITFFKDSFIGGLLIMLAGLLLIPSISNKFQTKFSFWRQRTIRLISSIGILLIGIIIAGVQSEKNRKKSNSVTEQKTINVIQTPNYEILKEITVRNDRGVSYFVLIDEVDLSNDKFINNTKLIVDKIVREKGSKINIEIVDNREALELIYKSHDGENTLGRILNKSELKLLQRHNIASFSGELETMPYPNSLDFFPSAFNGNPEVGRYKKTSEYNPN